MKSVTVVNPVNHRGCNIIVNLFLVRFIASTSTRLLPSRVPLTIHTPHSSDQLIPLPRVFQQRHCIVEKIECNTSVKKLELNK